MGYEFICGIPMVFIAALAIVLGLYITLEGLEDWAAGKPFFEIIKNFFVTPNMTNQQTNEPTYPITNITTSPPD